MKTRNATEEDMIEKYGITWYEKQIIFRLALQNWSKTFHMEIYTIYMPIGGKVDMWFTFIFENYKQ